MKSFVLVVCCCIVSCSSGVSPERTEHDDQFVQIYFHDNLLDELDTYHGTFQKDLVMDGTARTTMWLTTNEQEIIVTAIERYRFFSLPDTIPAIYTVMPDLGPKELRMKYKGKEKTIVWYQGVDPHDKSMYFVEQLRSLLWNIIVAKPEYKALPESHGGYARLSAANEREIKSGME
ncbi:MAG TPA: hypothetical protein VK470_15940 [Bacteroidota bacterium]|nr:hypothetical protein [Bacteroidota bacterium]